MISWFSEFAKVLHIVGKMKNESAYLRGKVKSLGADCRNMIFCNAEMANETVLWFFLL
jgi:hypothetical protein